MSDPCPSTPSEELFVKVQLGVRMNRRILKVLKATAEYMDMPLSGLLETMAVTNFQGQCVFAPDVLKQVERFSEIYGLDEMLDSMAGPANLDEAQESEKRSSKRNRRQ